MAFPLITSVSILLKPDISSKMITRSVTKYCEFNFFSKESPYKLLTNTHTSIGAFGDITKLYLEKYDFRTEDLSNVDHVHDFGLYIGNHPELTPYQIDTICLKLNEEVK